MSFEALGLHASICRALTEAGYSQPTPVQEQAIPAALAGKDLLVSSQTGSGKTAAFMLPALHKLATAEQPARTDRTPNQERQAARSRGERPRFVAAKPKMLVLTPTRELALQVTSAADKYSAYTRRLKTVAILGGMPYPKQMQLLARNPEVLVATPGRLIDHMESGKIDFSDLQMLVFDEADRMLDMGFIDDINKIVKSTPESRQTMLFSATLDGVVGAMARNVTKEPQIIQIASAGTKHENIEQRVHYVDDLSHKNRMLDHLLRDAAIDQAVIFTATKRDADQLADRLTISGFTAAALHGDMHQGARNRTLQALRRGQVKVLVATDVAARGIDVPNITHVFNYDLPKFAEDYVHRIGRTGRAGRQGIAVSLVNHAEGIHVKRIERYIKQTIPIDVIEGYEPKKAPAPGRSAGARKNTGWKPGDNRKARGFGGKKPEQRSFNSAPTGARSDRGDRFSNDRNDRFERSERSDRGDRFERSERAPRSAYGQESGRGQGRPARSQGARWQS